MRQAFSTIEQYLDAIELAHYCRRTAYTARVKGIHAQAAQEIMGRLSAVLDRIAHDKKAFAHWAHNDRNQGLASRQNACMCVRATAKAYAVPYLALRDNYEKTREHHA